METRNDEKVAELPASKETPSQAACHGKGIQIVCVNWVTSYTEVQCSRLSDTI